MDQTDAPTQPVEGAPPPKRSKLGAWLQLLRAPNLLTVPGDPLAGFCLVWAGSPDVTRRHGPTPAPLSSRG